MAESKTKRIFAKVSAETRNQFLAKTRLQGTTGQELIEAWVAEYLGGSRRTVPDADRRWMEKLAYILQHGDASTRAVVTGNLTLFEKVVEHGKR